MHGSLIEQVQEIFPVQLTGSVTHVVGQKILADGFPAPLGATAQIERDCGPVVDAEVIGFQDNRTLLLALGEANGIRIGNRIHLRQTSVSVQVGRSLQGRIVDSLGRPIDQLPPARAEERRKITGHSPRALDRPAIDQILPTGVKTIDGMLTLGVGQRVGIFSGSGVGKSTLLGQIARTSQADVNVIGLVGERGREVREFLERDLGPDGLARSVVVVATGDEPALHRYRAALTATTIAEYFRDQGKNVLLMMDSLTRFALAHREICFARDEPPVTRGFPSSVLGYLPKLLERSGRGESGSITGIYTVLVEGDDFNEPVSDHVRGILDGHIVLSRKLAHQAHFPAIDVLQSISRLMNHLTSAEQQTAAREVRQLLAAYQDSEDLIAIGAYQQGTNPLLDQAIARRDSIQTFLRQSPEEHQTCEQTLGQLVELTKPQPQPKTPQTANP